MPKHGISKVITTDLREHPAMRAWGRLRSDRAQPERIEILKGRKETSRRSVYRLMGAGPGGTAVIAKRYREGTANPERSMYAEVLPHLPVATPRYLGSAEEPGGPGCWLFFEDVGSDRYDPRREEHARLAGTWLGLLHTAGAQVGAPAELGDLGPSHYRHCLSSVRERIDRCLCNPALTADDRLVLQAILSRGADLDDAWRRVEAACAKMPTALVHGDFVAKNIRTRADGTELTLVVFDFECAGRGVPAVDLAQYPVLSRGFTANPDLAAYWVVVRDHWPGVTLGDVRSWAHLGTLFRTLVALDWDVWDLGSASTAEPMMSMRFYREALTQAVRGLNWES